MANERATNESVTRKQVADDGEQMTESHAQAFMALRRGSRGLRHLESEKKNRLLRHLADRVDQSSDRILKANAEDLARLSSDAAPAFRDRLTLNPKRLAAMTESLRQVAALPDPVGEIVEDKLLSNGLRLKRVRAPLGVIFMIFESRPNVILEAFSLAFKSGNAIALRGGSESRASAEVLYTIIRDALGEVGLDGNSFLGLNDYDRDLVAALLRRKDWIDIVVPRGGEKLIDFVQRTALMPIIKNDRGLCHAYVDDEADLAMAVRIVDNAKTQRPGVCNALETVLVHASIADRFLPALDKATEAKDLRWRVCETSRAILLGVGAHDIHDVHHARESHPRIEIASSEDWDTEHLDLILNCRVVSSLEEALEHIERHGSRHSETIITRSEKKARVFQAEVDAAVVYWNASTRFTDGFEFGLGGELGISTQKLHVRGPVGLRELTTPRWIADGDGQVRG